MGAEKMKINKTVSLSIKLEPELKVELGVMAVKRGMDLSKLARVVLANFIKPGTYNI
jgi:hypothetical protein